MDKGLVLMDEKGNSHFLRKEDFQKLLYADGGQFKMCYKLRQIHLDDAGGERQRVLLMQHNYFQTLLQKPYYFYLETNMPPKAMQFRQ